MENNEKTFEPEVALINTMVDEKQQKEVLTKEILQKVVVKAYTVRKFQKKYYATMDHATLVICKELEKDLDAMLIGIIDANQYLFPNVKLP